MGGGLCAKRAIQRAERLLLIASFGSVIPGV